MCIDFSNLNQACSKDKFTLSKIDQLVDSTAEQELFKFMDAYSGYNLITMFSAIEENTYFITDRYLYCYMVTPFGLKKLGQLIEDL